MSGNSGQNTKQSPSWWAAGLAAVVIAIIGFALGFSYGHAREDHIRLEARKAAQRHEVEEAQRELKAHAAYSKLNITYIRVVRGVDGVMRATWKQGFQTCTAKVNKPAFDNQLYYTDKVKAGSGGCSTDSGSNGLGYKVPGR